MNARGALVLGSALAAAIVAVPFGWLAGLFYGSDSESSSPNAVWIGHLLVTLPAMLAVAISAWWHSRGTRIVDCPDGTLSSLIAGWSFPVFATIVVFVSGIQRAIFVDRVDGIFGDLAMMSMAIMFAVLVASIFLYLPALFAEYAIVRLVRSDRMRALLSGVDS